MVLFLLLLTVTPSPYNAKIDIDSSFCGSHRVYVEKHYLSKRRIPYQRVYTVVGDSQVNLLEIHDPRGRTRIHLMTDDMNADLKLDLIIEERHIGHPDSLIYHVWVFRNGEPVKIGDIDIGKGGLDRFIDLDHNGMKEAVSWSHTLAGIGGLPDVVSPLLPKVYVYRHGRYVPETRRFRSYLREVAKRYEEELYTAVHDSSDEMFIRSKAMGLVAVYSMLGSTSSGLAKVKSISSEVLPWVKKHLPELRKALRKSG